MTEEKTIVDTSRKRLPAYFIYLKTKLTMTLNDYQQKAMSTAIYPEEYSVIYPTLGLNGEAGEVAEKVKKVLRDHDGHYTQETLDELAKELGDCLWYIATLANDLGFQLEEIAQRNVDKLSSRKERGLIHGNGDNR